MKGMRSIPTRERIYSTRLTSVTPARLNSLHYFLIWTSVTVLVPLSSFTVFVALGHELTVGTAFTVRRLPDCETASRGST